MGKASWTAACLIIGDEILTGKTQDSNSHTLAKFLFELGIDLKRIEVVADDAMAIGDAARSLSASHDFVFTSGGIGKAYCPTHDDITYESLAKAFNLTMQLESQTWVYLKDRLDKTQGGSSKQAQPQATSIDAVKRLATFPTPHHLIRSKLPIPVVVVNSNIFVLPGIPRLFQLLLTTLADPLLARMGTKNASPFYRAQVGTLQPEPAIARFLSDLQAKHRLDLKIGSYPKASDPKLKVVISVVGKDSDLVQAVAAVIRNQVDGWTIDSSGSRL
ncbi:Molybdopterin binding protein [Hesseltinella vesiculosa]|uniref:Molybdopterin binding protein n=1 Tax=Hesseltinella vesiculosa TaxID=101127 RepID=A0A1X2GYP0_9FUNG|nr:Molybdopterin binding protein [Hesseltinella vesiculosa]